MSVLIDFDGTGKNAIISRYVREKNMKIVRLKAHETRNTNEVFACQCFMVAFCVIVRKWGLSNSETML